ncbi:similar to Saccharomyces cerevisiae YMR287C DSS1 3'-5' exoribonuclease, component of the mitochondrial degradosome along with the ATP-dependent RNA helicase Suv3p [Maudiozyma saulgeensis]|uniref:Similar to Saccharomyces cerevisiae YMR287C DSS1 3'-5' exoribonuclease, component of the mitochondrial degradosome along with the ATP-dependent RNA helicase Suv3p n=1 Tax=Maudiozyma saulgeensis TaxID=1789683 RepID=A0A1X7R8V0_9SACH|nr:similar to Saccharomyces cerevisiae YMR287C DSS1 3'-5' exoribonuclease, component of the mitochondrial degradosome along with the ATP-dependent RNA helicase Suv3p [Kazachstania saulgeensis]
MFRAVRVRFFHSSTCLRRGKDWSRTPSSKYNNRRDLKSSIKPLSADDIDAINKQFLERTNGLEPEFEIKELADIQQEFKKRYGERYVEPSRKWFQYEWGNDNKPKIFTTKYINGREELNPTLLPKQSMSFLVTDLMKNTLTIGDMVLLGNTATQLAMCVALPDSVTDPRYTFILVDGELVFETKHAVMLRIPYALPEEVHKLVKKESHHEYAPIGKVKNSRDETFMTPLLANQLITSTLPFRISTEAWNQLPLVVKKLKLLHRYLNEPRGAIQISFVQLCQMVQSIDLDKIKPADVQEVISKITGVTNERIDSATFLATYWAIKEQQGYNLWGKIHTSSALFSPISVTVLPLKSQHYYYSEILGQMRQKNFKEINKFASLFNNREYEKIQNQLPHYLDLLRDYCAGNFHNNPQMISFISKIFRKIGKYKDSDICKDVCQELIETIKPSEVHVNPLHYNDDLALPISSHLAQDNKLIYDIVKPSLNSNGDDLRKDYTEMPVYCIDSEDAHEIDDGVSIRKLKSGNSELLIHIADPASFFPECDDESISNKIADETLNMAFEKSFTSYLPDNVDPMLPKSFSQAADLGKDGSKSKTITFAVEVSFDSDKGSLKVLKNTFNISLSYTSNFPRATYNDIDKILGGSKKVNPAMLDDIRNLYQIAFNLRRNRIQNDNAIIFGEGFNRGLPKLTEKASDEQILNIDFEDQRETSSTVLVSEFMILANSLCGEYFKKYNIPGVFRCYSNLEMSSKALRQYNVFQEKVKNGFYPTFKDITKISSFLNSSFYSADPLSHAMIGASQYLTVTSPLRRFPDLVNHLQLHRHLKGKIPLFSQDKIKDMIWRFQSRADITKRSARSVNTYWTLKYLEKIIKKKPDTTFDVVVLSVPTNGTVKCMIENYSYSRGILKLSKEKAPPLIGQSIKMCKITKIMPIEGILALDI